MCGNGRRHFTGSLRQALPQAELGALEMNKRLDAKEAAQREINPAASAPPPLSTLACLND